MNVRVDDTSIRAAREHARAVWEAFRRYADAFTVAGGPPCPWPEWDELTEYEVELWMAYLNAPFLTLARAMDKITAARKGA